MSANDKNQFAFRHSLRRWPLNDGTSAVVGRLARTREVQHDTALVGPAVEHLRDELKLVIDLNRTRCSAQQCQAADDSHDLLAFNALVVRDRQSLARESVDDRQGSQPASVEQRDGEDGLVRAH